MRKYKNGAKWLDGVYDYISPILTKFTHDSFVCWKAKNEWDLLMMIITIFKMFVFLFTHNEEKGVVINGRIFSSTDDASFASRQKFLVFCMCNKAVRVSYHPFWLTSIGYKKSARDYIELPFGIWISELYLWTMNMTQNYQFSRQKLGIFYL